MKKISILLFSVLLLLTYMGCSDNKTYSELQNEEEIAIKEYIIKEKIHVIDTLPDPYKWGPNDYYKSTSGLYFHMVNPGDTSVSLVYNGKVAVRYKFFKLTDPDNIIFSNWNTVDYPNPEILTYGYIGSSGSKGIQEALIYMAFHDSEAKIILPSNLNSSSSTYSSNVIPVGYDLKIKIPQ